MATTTTNFGWDIPQSTDLVKDGATAIAALGQDIDTAFVDFKGGTTGQVLKKTSGTDLDVEWGTASSGLTLINTTSFSGVSSQSINDIFSATYDHYQIVVNVSGSAFQSGSIRLRVAGADNTNATYDYCGQYMSSASTVWQNSGAAADQTNWLGFMYGTNGLQFNRINIYNPFSANRTLFYGETHEPGAGNVMVIRSGQFRNTTSFTGISFIQSGGSTFTGSIQVYGFNK